MVRDETSPGTTIRHKKGARHGRRTDLQNFRLDAREVSFSVHCPGRNEHEPAGLHIDALTLAFAKEKGGATA
ncbi:MAG: hypothetical protein NVS4B8_11640 [Herpetosiphon sp.]